jgi:hypothetical protein
MPTLNRVFYTGARLPELRGELIVLVAVMAGRLLTVWSAHAFHSTDFRERRRRGFQVWVRI